MSGLNENLAFEIYRGKWKSIYVIETKRTYDSLNYENKVLFKWKKYNQVALFHISKKFIFDF